MMKIDLSTQEFWFVLRKATRFADNKLCHHPVVYFCDAVNKHFLPQAPCFHEKYSTMSLRSF